MKVKYIIILIVILLVVPIVSADTTTFYTLYNGGTDGYIYRSGEEHYEDKRIGAGSVADADDWRMHTYITGGTTGSPHYSYLYRMLMEFNTTSLPDDATIDSAIVGLHGYNERGNGVGNPELTITTFSPATNGAYVAADFNKTGSTQLATHIDYASISASDYVNWTLNNDGKAAINKTGWTNLMLRDLWDITGDTTGMSWAAQWATSGVTMLVEEDGLGSCPYLDVVWTAAPAGSAPVSMFTASTNITRMPKSITFTNASTNTPTAWNYSFDDGTYSELENPVHSYTRRGFFNVTLNASNAFGYNINYTYVRVVGYATGSNPGNFPNPLMVNLDNGTFTSSRELSIKEKERVLWNMYTNL